MSTTTNRGRRLGLLFLATFIVGATGTIYRGLSGTNRNSTEFLNHILENSSTMQLAIGLDMLASAIGVFIALYMFPLIRKLKTQLAIAYVGIAMINFTVITLSNVIHISLLSIALDFGASEADSISHFITLAKMHYDAYYWVHFLMLMLYSVGGSVLYYFLYQARLVHRWLAVWGLLASVIVFLGGALQIADITVPFWLFIQNGIFMLTFIGYLLVLGFRKAAINFKTAPHGI